MSGDCPRSDLSSDSLHCPPLRTLLRLDVSANDARPDPAADWIALAEAGLAAGCDAVLLPAGSAVPDPWIVAAVLVAALPEVRVMVTLQAGALLPVAAAHLAQSLQSLSGGRALLACETDTPGVDASSSETAQLNRDQRLVRSVEFVSILRALWSSPEPLQHRGVYFRVENGRLPDLTRQRPPLYWSVPATSTPVPPRRVLAPYCDGLIEPTHAGPELHAAIERAYRARGLRAPAPHDRLRHVRTFDVPLPTSRRPHT
ncbi:LLM class flavin-dependent oxidoreductase [Paraburkholderia xenovorans]|uniref:LLM class flavin-dependent oxidoreductase n=1 Tax=Paraburkholderia xenovorans TaxID=36873 RepID=UPI0038B8C410